MRNSSGNMSQQQWTLPVEKGMCVQKNLLNSILLSTNKAEEELVGSGDMGHHCPWIASGSYIWRLPCHLGRETASDETMLGEPGKQVSYEQKLLENTLQPICHFIYNFGNIKTSGLDDPFFKGATVKSQVKVLCQTGPITVDFILLLYLWRYQLPVCQKFSLACFHRDAHNSP